MKKLKIVLILFLIVGITFIALPEKQFRKAKNETITEIAKEAGIPPFAAKFVINTKLGRKVAFLFIKKKAKSTSKK